MTGPKIGWIGLGNMGVPMAHNLAAAGYEVTVYNRTPEKAAGLDLPSAKSLEALASSSDIVITMLSDYTAFEEVVFGPSGIANALRPGQILIDMSTVGPAQSREAASRLVERGIAFLDAPVSGSVKPATEGTLVILAGGQPEVFAQARPLFDVLGKRAFHFGRAGQGSSAKLAVNLMLGLSLQALAEAVILGTRTGLDRDLLLDMIAETAVAAPIITMKSSLVRAGAYPPAFPLKHMSKDFRLAVEAALDSGVDLPATTLASTSYRQAAEAGFGDHDIMAILHALEVANAEPFARGGPERSHPHWSPC